MTIEQFTGDGRTFHTTTAYDKVGRPLTITDANNHVTRYQYDPNGNPELVAVAEGTANEATTGYLYDQSDNVKQRTDPDNRTTLYTYDPLDRMLISSAPDPAGGQARLTTTRTFNDGQHKVATLDPNGATTTTTLDPLGRVARIDYPAATGRNSTGGTFPIAGFFTASTYDPAGNRETMTDPWGVTDYHYDVLNRLIKVEAPQHPGANGQASPGRGVIEYLHDRPNVNIHNVLNCTALRYPQHYFADGSADPRVREVEYCADELGRMKYVRDWNGHESSYGYDRAGRLESLVYPNGTVAHYGYDDADRLLSVTNQRNTAAPPRAPLPLPGEGDPGTPVSPAPSGGATRPVQPGSAPRATPATDKEALPTQPLLNALTIGTITSHTYELDGVGNRKKATEVTGIAATSGVNFYDYDAQDRLIGVQYPEDAPGMGTAYDYSPGGDRDWTQRGPNQADRIASGYDLAGRLIDVGGKTYAADRNGNQTRRTIPHALPQGDTTSTINYDGANRLLSTIDVWSNGSRELDFRYNGDGLLLFEYRQDTDTARRYFTYDVSRPDPTVLYDGARFYIHGLGAIAQVQPGQGGVPDEYVYYHHDGLGSTRALTDKDGATLGSMDYDAFGLVRARGGAETDAFGVGSQRAYRFTGEPYESESETVYLRARHYDPRTGRFLQPDPAGYAGGPNLYAYAAGNPVTLVDHSGREPEQGGPIQLPLWLEEESETLLGETAHGPGTLTELPQRPARTGAAATNRARVLGNAGEESAQIIKNTERIPSQTGTAKYRTPDGLSHADRVLQEVKNVKELDYRSQIKDFVAYTQGEGYRYELFVRSTTRFSSALQDLIDEGIIYVRLLP